MPSQEKKLFIITEESKSINRLYSGLSQKGFDCLIASAGDEIVRRVAEQAPDLVLVEMNGS